MTQIETNCSQCGGIEFEDGFVEDTGQGSSGYLRWIPGALERGIFGGAVRLGKPRRFDEVNLGYSQADALREAGLELYVSEND